MDTWTDRKFSKRKFQSKGMKSYHAHIKQIILESTVLEFTWLVTDGFMEEYGLLNYEASFTSDLFLSFQFANVSVTAENSILGFF